MMNSNMTWEDGQCSDCDWARAARRMLTLKSAYGLVIWLLDWLNCEGERGGGRGGEEGEGRGRGGGEGKRGRGRGGGGGEEGERKGETDRQPLFYTDSLYSIQTDSQRKRKVFPFSSDVSTDYILKSVHSLMQDFEQIKKIAFISVL